MVEETKEPKIKGSSQGMQSLSRSNIGHLSRSSFLDNQGLPPKHGIVSKKKTSITNSDFDSDKQTVDALQKGNSRVSSKMNKIFERGTIPLDGDPLSDEDGHMLCDEHTQKTEEHQRQIADNFQEETDSYMVTKFRNGEGRKYRLSQHSNENLSSLIVNQRNEQSFQQKSDYENVQKRTQNITFGRRGTENLKANFQIADKVQNTSVPQRNTSVELSSVPQTLEEEGNLFEINQKDVDFNSEHAAQIGKQFASRVIQNVSSTRGDLPQFQLEHKKSFGTNAASVRPNIKPDKQISKEEKIIEGQASGLTLNNNSSKAGTISNKSQGQSQVTSDLCEQRDRTFHKTKLSQDSNNKRPISSKKKMEEQILKILTGDSSSMKDKDIDETIAGDRKLASNIIIETSLEQAAVSFEQGKLFDCSATRLNVQLSNDFIETDSQFQLQINSGEMQMDKGIKNSGENYAEEIKRNKSSQSIIQELQEQNMLLSKSEEDFADQLKYQIIKEKEQSVRSLEQEVYMFGHKGKKKSVDQIPIELNEQMIFSRLPQNYFIQDQDEELDDVFTAQNQIKMLRDDFITYVHQVKAPQSNDLSFEGLEDALDPTKFIQKHFGDEGVQDPQFLFKDIITEMPDVVQPESNKAVFSFLNNNECVNEQAQMITGEMFLKDAKNIESLPSTDEQILTPKELFNQQEHKVEFHHEPYFQANIDIKIKSETQKPTEHQQQVRLSKTLISKLFQAQLFSFEPVVGEVNVTKKIPKNRKRNKKLAQHSEALRLAPVKHLRMADYFNSDNQNNLESTQHEPEILAISEDAAQQIIEKWRKPKGRKQHRQFTIGDSNNQTTLSNIGQLSNNHSHLDITPMNQSIMIQKNQQDKELVLKKRQELEAKLEQDVLDNVETNFMFNKGTTLTSGLIDQDRIYNVMNKLKELAYKQINQGSKEIDYQEIIKFIQKENGVFQDDIKTEGTNRTVDLIEKQNILQNISHKESSIKEELSGITQEPPQPQLTNIQEENQRKWQKCVSFLRNNPKLLLQMIPDHSEDETEEKPHRNIDGNSRYESRPYKKVFQKGRLHQKMEEAQKWNETKKNNQVVNQTNEDLPDMNPYLPNRAALKTIFGQKLKEQEKPERTQSSQDKRELCSSGNPLKLNNKKHQKPIPLTSNNYPNEQLSFVTRSGVIVDEESVVQTYQKNTSYRSIGQDQSQGNSDEKKQNKTFNLKKNPLRAKMTLPRGISSQGMRKKIKNLNRPQTGNFYKSPCQRSDSNYLGGNFSRVLQSQNPSTLEATKFIKNHGITNVQGSNLSSQSGVDSRKITEVQMVQDQASINSGFFSRQNKNIVKRPITAGVNRALAMRQRSSERLASNKILISNVNTRQSLRQMQFSKGITVFTSKNNTKQLFRDAALSNKSLEKSEVDKTGSAFLSSQENYHLKNFCSQKNAITKKKTFKSRIDERKNYFSHGQRTLSRSQKEGIEEEKENQVSELYQPIEQVTRFETVDPSLTPIAEKNQQQAQDKIYETEKRRDSQDSRANDQIFAQEKELEPHPKEYIQKPTSRSSLLAEENIQQDYYDKQVKTENYSPYRDTPSNLLRGLPMTVDKNDTRLNNETKLSAVALSQTSLYQGISNLPIVDWAYSPLCIHMLQNQTEFNKEKDISVFVESEIDYVIEMIRDRFNEFKKTELMLPFYNKGRETLQQLLFEQLMHAMFAKFDKMYKEVTIENTLKLLLRCKLAFHSRKILLNIFDSIMHYELQVKEIHGLLDQLSAYKLEIEQLAHIKLIAGRMYAAGERVFQNIKDLKCNKKSSFKESFVFKKKDLVQKIKNEICEISKLVDVLRPKRRPDSHDSSQKGRYIAGIEDVPSSTSFESSQKFGSSNMNANTEFYWEPTKSMKKQEKEDLRKDRYIYKQNQKQKLKQEQQKAANAFSMENEHFSKKWYKQKKEW